MMNGKLKIFIGLLAFWDLVQIISCLVWSGRVSIPNWVLMECFCSLLYGSVLIIPFFKGF